MKAISAGLYTLVIAGILAGGYSVPAQGTAFTYQGVLNDGGSPANGRYDLQFTVYPNATNHGSLGIPVTLPATPVTNGLFTVTLDFGGEVYTGQPLWLEINVRSNGAPTGFTTLTPRQPLTAAPYAVTAGNLTGNLPASQITGALSGTFSGTITNSTFSGAIANSTFSGMITNSTFSGAISNSTFSGIVTNSTLAGDAQGGAITNLDSSIHNLNDSGGNLPGILDGLPSAGGAVYVPNGIFSLPSIPVGSYNAGFPPYAPGLTLYGNGSGMAVLHFAPNPPQTYFLDQSAGTFGQIGLNLKRLTLDGGLSPGSMGYVSAPGASGVPIWNDVEFDHWLVGAVSSLPDADYNDIQADSCAIGFTLAPYSDVSRLTFTRGFYITNADVEMDSRGNNAFIDASAGNIGLVVGGGGSDFIQITAETVTNAAVGIGFPSDWPFATTNSAPFSTQYAGTQYGNGTTIEAITAGWGYSLPPSVNWTDPFAYNNGAFMKVWNNTAFGGATIADEYLTGETAVISYTTVGDTAPYFFDHVVVGQTNLFLFSNSNSIPSQDGWQVGVNLPERQFTGSTLVYQRDMGGNLYAAGSITAGGALNASNLMVGSLTLTNAPANSLVGTGAGGNLSGIAIGSGLTLSGGTLSASLVGGPLAGTSINTYTADHTVTAADGTILVNGSGLTITLPDATLSAGHSYTIKLVGGSGATVSTTSSQAIDSSANYSLSAPYKYVTVQSDGSQWWVLANN